MASKFRVYVADIPGGTATTTIQIQDKCTAKAACFSFVSAAAGSYELSLSATSQIGTAQPTKDVLARVRISATAGPSGWAEMPLNVALVPFQSVYVHCTGAANVGQVNLMVS